jgi:hypothetical protein
MAFVAARIYNRFRLAERLDWSDMWLVVSAVDAVGLIICDTLTFQMGVLDDYATSERLSKVSVILCLYLSGRVSLAAFVWRLVPVELVSSRPPGLVPTSLHANTGTPYPDLVCLELLLRLWPRLAQVQHARLLLGLLQAEAPANDAQGPLGYDWLCRRVLLDWPVQRHVLLRQGCLGTVVSRRGRLLRLLRPRALYPKLHTWPGLLSCCVRASSGSPVAGLHQGLCQCSARLRHGRGDYHI